MTAKEKAIAAEYGEAWEKVKPYVDEDGWVKREVTGRSETNGMEPTRLGYGISQYDMVGHTGDGGYRWRLVSLRNIISNNGWIRCDERLPELSIAKLRYCIDGVYKGITNAPSIVSTYNAHCDEPDTYQNITHWRPVEAVKPPIY